jgi:hypothetical protein
MHANVTAAIFFFANLKKKKKKKKKINFFCFVKVTHLVVGPTLFTKGEHETVVFGPEAMVMVRRIAHAEPPST